MRKARHRFTQGNRKKIALLALGTYHGLSLLCLFMPLSFPLCYSRSFIWFLVEKSPDMLAYLLQRFLSASLVHCQKNLVLAVGEAVYVGRAVKPTTTRPGL
jgi:hypothetical protein